jgi:hypothetical protein
MLKLAILLKQIHQQCCRIIFPISWIWVELEVLCEAQWRREELEPIIIIWVRNLGS